MDGNCHHGSSIGTKSAVATAKILTLTGIDILLDEAFMQEIKTDFDKRTKGFEHKTPLSASTKEPISLPDEMRSHGSVLDLKESFYKQAGDDQSY